MKKILIISGIGVCGKTYLAKKIIQAFSDLDLIDGVGQTENEVLVQIEKCKSQNVIITNQCPEEELSKVIQKYNPTIVDLSWQ